MIAFTHTDAWILYAIPTRIKDCPLSEIMARADYVNHAIPTKDEMEKAITKGLRCGLLERSLSGVKYALSHREAVENATGKSRYALKAWDALYQFLSKDKWEQINEERFSLTLEDVDGAYQEYLRKLGRSK